MILKLANQDKLIAGYVSHLIEGAAIVITYNGE